VNLTQQKNQKFCGEKTKNRGMWIESCNSFKLALFRSGSLFIKRDPDDNGLDVELTDNMFNIAILLLFMMYFIKQGKARENLFGCCHYIVTIGCAFALRYLSNFYTLPSVCVGVLRGVLLSGVWFIFNRTSRWIQLWCVIFFVDYIAMTWNVGHLDVPLLIEVYVALCLMHARRVRFTALGVLIAMIGCAILTHYSHLQAVCPLERPHFNTTTTTTATTATTAATDTMGFSVLNYGPSFSTPHVNPGFQGAFTITATIPATATISTAQTAENVLLVNLVTFLAGGYVFVYEKVESAVF
jgi:hypothetical protein